MKLKKVSFSVTLFGVASWLSIAYSTSLVNTLNSYEIQTSTQFKLMAFTLCIYATVLAIAKLINLFKPTAVLLIMIAAPAWYYMLQYGIVIDAAMLINAIETDLSEAREQLSTDFFIILTFMGIVPSLLLIYIRIPRQRLLHNIIHSTVVIMCFAVLAAGIAYTNYDEFASLFRNHRDIKHRIVPYNVVAATVSVIKQKMAKPSEFVVLGTDAVRINTHLKPRVMVVILGETARADHFTVNGYPRLTTPMLSELTKSAQLLSYKQAISCGTATAVSVPCMFSFYDAKNYNSSARNASNVLDVLEIAGVRATWIENNSGCKNVCDRINTIMLDEKSCNNSICYDTDMLKELSSLLENVTQDSVIVLHQMGSHGPAYFKRSPEQMKRFLPECVSLDLTQCTLE